ncbi:MAG: hypothetical protein R2865_06985 [Deinococcales bacterium]
MRSWKCYTLKGLERGLVELETDTRTNVVQDDSNKQLRITAKGYEVSKEDIHNLIESIFDLPARFFGKGL